MNFFKKFNKLDLSKKENKKALISFGISLLGIILLLIGTSTAYLSFRTEGTVNTLTSGTLSLTLPEEGNSIVLQNALPTTDTIGLKSDKVYTFTMRSSSSISSYYEIRIVNICSTSENISIDGSTITPDVCVPNEYIRVGVSTDSGEYVVVTPSTNGIVTSGFISDVVSEIHFEIKIWLAESTPNTYQGKTTAGVNQNSIFAGKLQLYSRQLIDGETVSSNAPSCSWTNGPSVGNITDGVTATYTLCCTDTNVFSDSDISASDFSLEGTANTISITNVTKSAITNGFNYIVTVTGSLIDGSATLALKDGSVKNFAGKSNSLSDSSPIIRVNNVSPICNWDSGPSVNDIKNGTTATYTLSCTDINTFSDSDISAGDFTIGGTTGAISVTNITKSAITNGFSYIVTITGLGTNGSAHLTLNAGSIVNSNLQGNDTSDASSTIIVDNVLPTCSIAKSNTGTTSVTLTVTGADDYLSSTPYSWESSTSGYSTTNTKAVGSAGTYTAYVIDQAGNVGSCSSSVTSSTQYRYQTRGATANYYYTWGFCGDGYGSSAYGVTYYQDSGDTKTYWRPAPSSYTSSSSGLTSCSCSNPGCNACTYYSGSCCTNNPSYCTCSSYTATLTKGYYTCNPPSGKYTRTSGSNGNSSSGGGTSTCTYKVYTLYGSTLTCNLSTSCTASTCTAYGSQYYCSSKYTTSTTNSTWHSATTATRYNKYYYTAETFTAYRCYRYDSWSGWSGWSTSNPGSSSSTMNVESRTILQ